MFLFAKEWNDDFQESCQYYSICLILFLIDTKAQTHLPKLGNSPFSLHGQLVQPAV